MRQQQKKHILLQYLALVVVGVVVFGNTADGSRSRYSRESNILTATAGPPGSVENDRVELGQGNNAADEEIIKPYSFSPAADQQQQPQQQLQLQLQQEQQEGEIQDGDEVFAAPRLAQIRTSGGGTLGERAPAQPVNVKVEGAQKDNKVTVQAEINNPFPLGTTNDPSMKFAKVVPRLQGGSRPYVNNAQAGGFDDKTNGGGGPLTSQELTAQALNKRDQNDPVVQQLKQSAQQLSVEIENNRKFVLQSMNEINRLRKKIPEVEASMRSGKDRIRRIALAIEARHKQLTADFLLKQLTQLQSAMHGLTGSTSDIQAKAIQLSKAKQQLTSTITRLSSQIKSLNTRAGI